MNLDSVSSTDSDHSETDLLELLSVQHQSATRFISNVKVQSEKSAHSKTKAGLGQLA